MTPHKKKRFDFFAEYHKEKFSKISSYLFSGAFSLVLAFAVVSYSQGGDMKWLMASVANLTPSVQYQADIVASHSGGVISFVFGSEAKKVESISFTLVGNPESLQSISTDNPQLTLTTLAGWMYHGVLQLWGKDIVPGEELVRMNMVGNADSMSLIDTKFVSEGKEYVLSNVFD